ncbi:hypothetical protein MNBD_DELTA03-1335 [hydrothermal vent metagenome]|uniref:Thioredoxin domain-containing protein n=1 Tax=hydrothermal vent metagenome TaxID=652676 RepID=A0A3B0VNI3_9ZZZZ
MPKFFFIILALTAMALPGVPAQAKVYTTVAQTYKTNTAPLDITTSEDGRHTFVLTKGGKVLIYGRKGLEEQITVDPVFNRITAAVGGDRLFLSSSKTRQIREVLVDFVHKIDISGSPFLGPEKAKVTLVVFSDFQCPHCAKLGPLFEQILNKDPDTVKIVYKNFPLNIHRYAAAAALAATAADMQGKFWQYHDLIFENYQSLSIKKLISFARRLDLNIPQFKKDMNSNAAKLKVGRDYEEGRRLKVTGTPTIFIDGRLVRERSFDNIQKMIDEELREKNK